MFDALLLYLPALCLYFGEFLLAVSALLQHRDLAHYLLHGMGEAGQLPGDAPYVIGACDCADHSPTLDCCPPFDPTSTWARSWCAAAARVPDPPGAPSVDGRKEER